MPSEAPQPPGQGGRHRKPAAQATHFADLQRQRGATIVRVRFASPLETDTGRNAIASSSGIGNTPRGRRGARHAAAAARCHACARCRPPTRRPDRSPARSPPSHARASAAGPSDPERHRYDRHILRRHCENFRKFVCRYPSDASCCAGIFSDSKRSQTTRVMAQRLPPCR